jgi:transcriptional regulator with XRE-family HTH domain
MTSPARPPAGRSLQPRISVVDSPRALGAILRAARTARRLRLEDVALGAGVGIRFVSELERGKPTARLGETLRVVAALGLTLSIEDPDDPPTT